MLVGRPRLAWSAFYVGQERMSCGGTKPRGGRTFSGTIVTEMREYAISMNKLRYLPITSNDIFVFIYWHGIFENFLCALVTLSLWFKRMGTTGTNCNRLCVFPRHGGSQMVDILQTPLRPGGNISLCFFSFRCSLAIVSHPATYRAPAAFFLDSTSIYTEGLGGR